MISTQRPVIASIVLLNTQDDRTDLTLRSLGELVRQLHRLHCEVLLVGTGTDDYAMSSGGAIEILGDALRILKLPGESAPTELDLLRHASYQAAGDRIMFFESGARVTAESIALHTSGLWAHNEVVFGDVTINGKRAHFPFNNMSATRTHLLSLAWPSSIFHVDRVSRYESFKQVLQTAGSRLSYHSSNVQWSTLMQGSPSRKLKSLAIWISDRCNLPCIMCRNAVTNSRPPRREMTLPEVCRLIDEAKAAGAESIELTEGEPMIWPHFCEILRYATSCGLEISFVTNGTRVTEQIVETILQSKVGDVPVSIDGPPSIHDRIRGPNAFAHTKRGVEMFRKRGVAFSIFTVASRLNIECLPDMIDLAKQWGAQQISFQPISRNQSGTGSAIDDMLFSSADVPLIEDCVRRTIERSHYAGVRIRSRAVLRAIPEYVRSGGTAIPRNGCGLPGRMAYVDHNRNVLTCFVAYAPQVYRRYEPGRLSEIWNSKQYQSLSHEAACGSCKGCLANCSDLEECYR